MPENTQDAKIEEDWAIKEEFQYEMLIAKDQSKGENNSKLGKKKIYTEGKIAPVWHKHSLD